MRHTPTNTRARRLVLRLGTTLVLTVGLALALAACSDDENVTGPDQGEVSATVTDDPSSTSGSIARASFLDVLALQASGSFSGTTTADATVEVRTASGTWIDVGSATDAALEMQSESGELVVGNGATVDAGSYTAVRLTLDDATTTADVQAATTAFLAASSG